MVTTHFDLVSDPFWVHRGPKRARFGPKCPFWGPRRAPRGQIWSRLPPIGPSGLDSWSPHTFTWYRAPSGPPGVLKGPVLARNAPFGALGGPRRAPGDQIWSQLPPIGPSGLDSWSPHTLTWYRAPSGSLGVPKGPILAQNVPFWLRRGPRRSKWGPSKPNNPHSTAHCVVHLVIL